MGQYQPDAPDVLGVEWPPLYQRDVPLDAGMEYGQTFRSTAAETLTSAFAYLEPPADTYRFHLLATVYEKGQELATGRVQRTMVPVNGGTNSGGVLVGGTTIADCLASVGDTNRIVMTDGDYLLLQFATAGLFTGKRILHLILHHAFESTDPEAENPELGANLIADLSGLYSAAYGVLYSSRLSRTTDLGEVYPHAATGGNLNTDTERRPWTVADVQALDGALQLQLVHPGDGSPRHFHYVALEVVWCEENRLAVGAQVFGTTGFGTELYAVAGRNRLPLYTPSGAIGWAKPATGEFTVTLGLADTGGPYLPSEFGLTYYSTYGPAPEITLLDSFEVFGPHEGRALPRGVDNEARSAEAVTPLPPVDLSTTTVSPDPHSYIEQLQVPVYTGVNAVQEIREQAAAAATPFPFVRFWARRYGDATSDLTVTIGASTVMITAAVFDALAEIIDGWREVVLEFASPPTFGTTGANKNVTFSSPSAIADRWEILGMLNTGKNLLTANQADVETNTTGFAARANTTISRITSQAAHGTASLQSQSVAAGEFGVDTLTGLSGVPVVAGKRYTMTARVRRISATANRTASPLLVWYTAAGAFISFALGAGVVDNNTSWVRVSVADIAPPTAAFASISIAWTATAAAEQHAADMLSLHEGVSTEWIGVASATGPSYGGGVAAATYSGVRDPDADLAVNVATKPQTIAGLGAAPGSYPVPGLGFDCDESPGCIPTDIGYVELTWSGSAATGSGVTGFGYYEVQRKDTDPASTEFVTIAHVDDRTTPSFSDFEARQNVTSTYRVRLVNGNEVGGLWSSEVTGSPPAPSGAAAGVLIFTSNVDPTGSVAYGEAFEGAAVEEFSYPEAETRQLQRFYQRDYQTAFRPTERGGTAFSRALLIGDTRTPSASADSAFDALRDLAWDAALPYVCVKDDQGNRWLANVNVPSSVVRKARSLFVAQVTVTEVTDVPSIGDRVVI